MKDKCVKKGLKRMDPAMGQGTGKINVHLAVFSSILAGSQGNTSECWDIYTGLVGLTVPGFLLHDAHTHSLM